MLIMDMRDHLHERAPDLIRLSGLPEKPKRAEVAGLRIDAEHPEHKPPDRRDDPRGDPLGVHDAPLHERVPGAERARLKIADMRRSSVVEESKMPKQAESALA